MIFITEQMSLVEPVSAHVESVLLYEFICAVPVNEEMLAERVSEQVHSEPMQDTTTEKRLFFRLLFGIWAFI